MVVSEKNSKLNYQNPKSSDNMKKALYSILALLLSLSLNCSAIDRNEAHLLSLLKLTPATATADNITSILGKPEKIEDNKKTTLWYYTMGENNLVISWSKKSNQFEKFTFSNECTDKCPFDKRLSRKLRSGATNLTQTIQLLGAPKDMTIKNSKQELHYTYDDSVLRLFFRNNVLVDYTLLGRGGN